MSDILRPDLCVIGAGPGGLSAAAMAASFGVSVVLVEESEMGGALRSAAIPSKILAAAAGRVCAVPGEQALGSRLGELSSLDANRAQARGERILSALDRSFSVERCAAIGIKVIQAAAKFIDATRVKAGSHVIQARHFIIATGGTTHEPAISGLAEIPYLAPETLPGFETVPPRLLILGSSAIAVELAQACCRLGSDVTVIEPSDRILKHEDPEMAAVIERSLVADGVVIRTQALPQEVTAHDDGQILVRLATGEALEGSHLMVAAERRPTVAELGLDAAGIAFDETGIVVDRGLKTSNTRVYAIGDCAGGHAARAGGSVQAAQHQAGLVVRNALFRLPINLETAPIPRVVWTAPELAVVGLTEEEARASHRSIRVLRWPLAENDRARLDGTARGHVKALATPRGQILGCAIAGERASELIAPWVLALAHNLKIADLAGVALPYPTLSEATKKAAVEFVKPATQNPWIRRVIGITRIFG